jgi:hypothetical protein
MERIYHPSIVRISQQHFAVTSKAPEVCGFSLHRGAVLAPTTAPTEHYESMQLEEHIRNHGTPAYSNKTLFYDDKKKARFVIQLRHGRAVFQRSHDVFAKYQVTLELDQREPKPLRVHYRLCPSISYDERPLHLQTDSLLHADGDVVMSHALSASQGERRGSGEVTRHFVCRVPGVTYEIASVPYVYLHHYGSVHGRTTEMFAYFEEHEEAFFYHQQDQQVDVD